MHFVFAPMEGITGYVFRNVRQKYYQDVEAYYTPFISPDEHHFCSPRNYRDILPENNRGVRVIPQVMTNRSEYFVRAARELVAMGYDEVNLNLGCPSGTVFNKHRGAGMLREPEELERFLDDIYSALTVKVTIKTRLGVSEPEEFYGLLEIYNRFPVGKLIIHPRVRTDFYKGTPRLSLYKEAMQLSRAPLCYNGNIFSRSGYERLMREVPGIGEVMIGRGLVANPGLIGEIGGSELDKQILKSFHDELLEAYQEQRLGEKQLLFKMKEQWYYMASIFPGAERQIKKIRKVNRVSEYENHVRALFAEYDPETAVGFEIAR